MQRLLIFIVVGLMLAGSVIAYGNRTSRSNYRGVVLAGTLYDLNRAVIADGEVVAMNINGEEFWTRTNTEGVYKFELPPATYKIEANAPGFCPRRVEQFRLRHSAQGPLDFVLAVASSVMLETDRTTRPCAQQTMIKKKEPTKGPNSLGVLLNNL